MSNLTPVQEFYKNKTVFLTGFTGFLGHAIFEKLLRSCPDIKKIYILVRPKKGMDSKQRLEKIFNIDFFDRLKEERPDFADRVSIMEGDLLEDNLGLSEQNIQIFLNEVNILIHSAATIKFDEKMKIAVKLNICSTKYFLELVKECSNFQAFVHISTAYSNCYRHDIEEQFYTPIVDPFEFIETVKKTDENELERMKNEFIGDHPNTYTFTKNLAEHVVKTQGQGLPVCVVRPSIILGTNEEPHKGWTGNSITGIFGIMGSFGVGLMRVFNMDPNGTADFIPVDIVANSAIVAAYNTAQKTKHDDIEIYNLVTGNSNPITWAEHMGLGVRVVHSYPVYKSFWTPMSFCIPYITLNKILQILLHTIPAYLFDFLYIIMGKKPFFVDFYKKLHAAYSVTEYFRLRSWNFSDTNTRKLFFSLCKQDQKMFNFDVKKIKWDFYHFCTMQGVRKDVLRDPLSSIPAGMKQNKWRSLINIILFALLVHYTFSPISLIIIGTVLTSIIMCGYY